MTASTDRRSALEGWSAQFSAASKAPETFAIRELPFTTQINLRGDSTVAAPGFELPFAANTWSGTPGRSALWLGPDEWLIVAPEGMNESIVSTLRTGMHVAVTDLSASRTVIEIAGTYARVVLAKGCPLDLHARAFGPPQCAQTLLAKAQIILQCTDARPVFHLYVRNSFAAYVAEWLMDAAAECDASHAIDAERIASRFG